MNKIICISCNKNIEQGHFFKLIRHDENPSCSVMHIDCNNTVHNPVKWSKNDKLLLGFIASRY